MKRTYIYLLAAAGVAAGVALATQIKPARKADRLGSFQAVDAKPESCEAMCAKCSFEWVKSCVARCGDGHTTIDCPARK